MGRSSRDGGGKHENYVTEDVMDEATCYLWVQSTPESSLGDEHDMPYWAVQIEEV